MLGLAHRGFELADYGHHLVHTLRDAGYWSGADRRAAPLARPGRARLRPRRRHRHHHVDEVAPAALRADRASARRTPFFLSVGFFETHREYFEPTSVRDALYSLPPANLPDTPETRRDMAAYKASARSLDQGVGAVLNALDEHDLADDTLVILTTDHGLAFPGAKATLTDRGHRRAADHARARAASTAARSPTRSSRRSTSSRRSASSPGIEPPDVAAGPLAAAARAARGRRGQRRDLRRAHLPRRLRAAARDPHAALQVHPPLRRPAARRCSRTSTTARPRTCCSRHGWARRASCRARSSTTWSSTPPRPPTWPDDPAYADVARRAARAAGRLDARDRTTRCSTATSSRRPAPSSPTPTQVSPADTPIAHR